MTLAALMARIDAAEIAPAFAPQPYTVDWFYKPTRTRRGAKGGGMEGVRGPVTYAGLTASLPPDEALEVGAFPADVALLYLRARSIGLTHDRAMLIGYLRAGEATEDEVWELLAVAS